MKRFISIICLSALLICITANVKAKAATLPAAYDVLAKQPGVDITSLYYAYEQLSFEQQTIVHYIIGAYNNMYLTARGFSYNIQYSQNAVMEEFKTLGQRVLDFAFTSNGWRSRVNEVFRQYISGAIVYASQINTSFMTWYNNLINGTIPELFIPYTEDAFDAWTTFYDDPSGDGIASFGDIISIWQSGIFNDFAFVGISWDSSAESIYNNIIVNENPVLYSNTKQNSSGSETYQRIIGCHDFIEAMGYMPNALFVLRSNSNYSSFRYGFDDFRTNLNNYSWQPTSVTMVYTRQNNQVHARYYNGSGWYCTADFSIQTSPSAYDNVGQLINYAFYNKPLFYDTMTSVGDGTDLWSYAYPYVEHVYLVDDLSTLSNPEEVFNVDDLHIVAPSNTRDPYIIAPNDRLLFTTRPVGYDDPLGFWDIIRDNSYDPDTGEQATDDDFTQQIVNNTTINNYYVTNDDRINVPVEWFENELSDQLANDSIPFLTFARDCIDTLGDLQIYFYGALVFGLGGGILKKFLL